MDRKKVIQYMAFLPLFSTFMKLQDLHHISSSFQTTPPMPVLFLGHGSPMNAIEENEFIQGFRTVASQLPLPKAILCISAHWETKGTFVTAMQSPKTIHDFGGFPKALFEVEYPAPGSPELATETQLIIKKTKIELDYSWGLDHGAWSVLKHLYPNANIPVIQMSLDYTQHPKYHYELAKELNALRRKGILIIGSGNMVHNLGRVEWSKLNESFGFDWALEANEKMKSFILNNDQASLINYSQQGVAFQLSIPTPEHYFPLIYAVALKEKNDSIQFFNDKPVAGSLTMTSVRFG
jgi:4,5-DOPA dioxygenase extradiol